MDRFNCVDCLRNTIDEYYMVHDVVWEAARMQPHGGMLCIGCLETRLGRTLTADDFTNYPINRDAFSHRSARLRHRLRTHRTRKAA
jgi:hypothetical protein